MASNRYSRMISHPPVNSFHKYKSQFDLFTAKVMAMKAQHLKGSNAARSLTLLQQKRSARKYRHEKQKFLARSVFKGFNFMISKTIFYPKTLITNSVTC